jgi:murein L,D-transpeptidase YafK
MKTTTRLSKTIPLLLILTAAAWATAPNSPFREAQDRYPRVRAARRQAQPRLEALFRQAGVTYPPRRIFLRIFKDEGECELWAADRDSGPLTRIKTYAVCASSGEPGPKRRQGDLQVPEGFYHVCAFNPWSNFHLSLKINYPNASDRVLGDRRDPGGDIFIHGSCVTIGCVPLRDDPIEEVYLAAVDARSCGQARIPVHIFPFRMNGSRRRQDTRVQADTGLQSFWANLHQGFDFFESRHVLPRVTIDGEGRYHFHDPD